MSLPMTEHERNVAQNRAAGIDAWQEGYDAHCYDGLSLADNPYPDGDRDGADWEDGWRYDDEEEDNSDIRSPAEERDEHIDRLTPEE